MEQFQRCLWQTLSFVLITLSSLPFILSLCNPWTGQKGGPLVSMVGWLDGKHRPHGATDANGLFRIADSENNSAETSETHCNCTGKLFCLLKEIYIRGLHECCMSQAWTWPVNRTCDINQLSRCYTDFFSNDAFSVVYIFASQASVNPSADPHSRFLIQYVHVLPVHSVCLVQTHNTDLFSRPTDILLNNPLTNTVFVTSQPLKQLQYTLSSNGR